MRITAHNRQDDEFPILDLEVENQRDVDILKKLLVDLRKVQEIGIVHGVAEECEPPVGYSTYVSKHNIRSMSIKILIGEGKKK